ncbi:hypothetical protein C2857_003384 [Epichloe festucae Fl1]|uniref:Uncharacterized protein n=1 Tax=Epichloe festucae (strain Fl1) TaxID=877507 RepID=A0A7S9KNW8_EPIFF|nr:hypothetical protein C2857_003384 [Epichloe festucae Fl1]
MASVKVHSGVFGHSTGKISKSRGRTVVKPILKKLHSHSDRESSLDLDRGWDDQPSPSFAGPDFGTYDSDGSYHYSAPAFANTRSGRDVIFSLSATDIAGVGGHGAGALAAGREGARSKYSHVRSTSGNSHTSSIATTTSGRNGSTFVHPFQQTPYTSTPPLSYANSRASFENGITTGYSSTITEDDDDIDPYPSLHSTSTTPRPALYQSAYFQHPNHRRPSLASQRTSSISDGNQTARISATRSSSAQVRPLGTASVNQSKSELNPSTVSSETAGSPLSSTAPLGTAAIILSSLQTNLTSSPASPMSPLRNSLDMGGFRMRSRSEVDMSTHQEQVREARRKFEAKERAKEEKYAREQHRKQERAENREAHRMEKTHSRLRKGSGGNGSVSSSTMSSGTDIRITTSRKQDAVFDRAQEKIDFSTHGYNSTHDGQSAPTRADKVHFTSPLKRTKTAKRKTAGVWTAFVLWFRTRLLKLGRR